jgi:kynureninase
MAIDLEHCKDLDAADPMADLRGRFETGEEHIIYLDANSLGPVPADAAARLEATVSQLWGRGRCRSWAAPQWIEAPARIGAKLARLIGAEDDEVIVGDGTSVNLFKLLMAALTLQPDERRVILSERDNFPSDLHIAQGIVGLDGQRYVLKMVEQSSDLLGAIDDQVAVITLTHSSFRTGACHDLNAITELAHEAGALVVWDISHSVGATEVDLNGAGADFAVGCGYKYLGGGPGSPAFAFVRKELQAIARNPLSGWMSHADTMAFETDYRPAEGMRRFLCGSPEVLALAVLEAALDVWEGVDPKLAFEKNRALTGLFIDLVEQELSSFGFTIITPKESARRGGQVTIGHECGAKLTEALAKAGVLCSFRAPNAMRFGFQPFCLRFTDVWAAVGRLREVMEKD